MSRHGAWSRHCLESPAVFRSRLTVAVPARESPASSCVARTKSTLSVVFGRCCHIRGSIYQVQFVYREAWTEISPASFHDGREGFS